MTSDKHAYNPLDRVHLGESVVRALLESPCDAVPPAAAFDGAGLYALYYQGPFSPYAAISSSDCGIPIYVGKAVPPGARSGRVGLGVAAGRVLFSRLRHHAGSLESVQNLEVDDFRCRYLIVDDIWIPLGESLLIRHFQPLWNTVIEGFGINDPGARRYGGDRSDWDELHAGRSWYPKMRQATTPASITARIAAHFASNQQ